MRICLQVLRLITDLSTSCSAWRRRTPNPVRHGYSALYSRSRSIYISLAGWSTDCVPLTGAYGACIPACTMCASPPRNRQAGVYQNCWREPWRARTRAGGGRTGQSEIGGEDGTLLGTAGCVHSARCAASSVFLDRSTPQVLLLHDAGLRACCVSYPRRTGRIYLVFLFPVCRDSSTSPIKRPYDSLPPMKHP